MAVIRRAASSLAFVSSLLLTSITASAVDLDPSHLAVPGDFNADGRLDVLLQPMTTAAKGSLVLQDGTGELSVVAQGWDPNYLGLDWSAAASEVATADLNGDGQDDVIVQPRKAGGTAAVVVTDPSVQILSVAQLLPPGYLGLDWSTAGHLIVAGDFDGDRHKELFLQAVKRGGTGMLVHADAQGHLVAAYQSFPDAYLGRHWSAADETFYVGDFNGDGRQDLLVQSKLGVGESAYALLLADGSGRFTSLNETWNLKDLGADWNPVTHSVVIEDANGDGIMDITLRSKTGGTNYLFEGNTQGSFTTAAAHWTGTKTAADALKQQGKKTGTGTKAGIGIGLSGPTANSISLPTHPEQDPVLRSGQGTQGSGQIMTVNAAGTLKGSGGVSGGTATYSIPISVPPGIAGMQPSISLNYSSRGGNGEVGMGWSLSAGSQIHRCPATHAMDGNTAGVTYGSTDRLCLDGQHLVLVSGSYGTDGAVYRTELDAFKRITESGDITSTSSAFTVLDHDGHDLHYGNTSGSYAVFKPTGAAAPLAWGLGRDEDTYSNSIIYYYSTFGSGEFLLTSIKYTGTGATAGNREVDFTYTTRSDVSSQYLSGGFTLQTQLLSSITTLVSGVRATSYNLEYATSAATKRSLLQGVQECAGVGSNTLCLPETTFTWHAPATAFNSVVNLDDDLDFTGLGPVSVVVTAAGDFDGDGRKDVIYSAPGVKTFVYFVASDGSATHTDITNLFGGGIVDDAGGDLDNDGAADLLGFFTGSGGTERYAYATYAPSSGGFVVHNLTIPFTYTVQGQVLSNFTALADVDGDGLTDLVVQVPDPDNSGNHMLAAYINQTVTCSPQPCTNTVAFSSTPTKLISIPDYTDTVGVVHTLTASPAGDLDGNGLPDFAVSYLDSSGTLHDGWIFVKEGGAGNLTAPFSMVEKTAAGVAHLAQDPTMNPRMIDINGDGLPDIVYDCGPSNHDWCYQLNQGGANFAHYVDTGVGDVQSGSAGNEGAIMVADLDGDGVEEILSPATMVADFCQHYDHYTQEGGTGPADVCANNADDNDATATLSASQDRSIYQYDRYRFVPQADATTEDGSGYRYVPHQATSNIVAQARLALATDVLGDGLTGVISPFTKGSQGSFFVLKSGTSYPKGPGVAANSAGSATDLNAAPDLMLTAVDGFGATSQWYYYPLSSNKIYNSLNLYQAPTLGSAGRYDSPDYFFFNSSMYVVGSYTVDDGIGGTRVHDFHYGQAIYNNQGRGFQGFRTVMDDDMASGARTVQVYHQHFPLSGELEKSWVMPVGDSVDLVAPVVGTDALSYTSNDWGCLRGSGTTVTAVDGISCNTILDAMTYVPVLKHSTVDIHDVIHPSDKLSTTDTTYCVVSSAGACTSALGYDTYGNSLGSVTTVTDAAGTYTSSVSATYHTADTTNWWLDRLDSKVTTNQATYGSTPQPQVTRTTVYTYDSNSVRAVSAVDAQADGSAAYDITTNYTYDAHGNVIIQTVGGGSGSTHIGNRTTNTVYAQSGADAFYFPIRVQDPSGQSTVLTADDRFGAPLTVTDPNGVETDYAYDVFGRKTSTQVVAPVSVSAENVQYLAHTSGDGYCDSTSATSAYLVLVSQSGHPTHYTCYDILGRGIRSVKEGFSSAGDNIYQSTYYDSLGRVLKVNEPHYADISSPWNVNAYESNILGRLHSRTDAKGVTTTYTYNPDVATGAYRPITTGIATTTSDSPERDDQETKNSLGKMLSVTNAVGATEQAGTQYAYDSDGNPVTITPVDGSGTPLTAQAITAQYNVLGQKVQVTDPDQGTSTYVYNVAGELTHQTDAKGQAITMSYDSLGRMTSKVAPEGETDWYYDGHDTHCGDGATIIVAPYIGKLRCVVQGSDGYQQNYGYDDDGRADHVHDVIPGKGSFDTDTVYDSYGRVDTVTYPASVSDAVPVANAGSHQYVAPGATVTLHGSATDADGPNSPLFQWSQTGGPSISLSSATAASPTFTAGSALATSYTFQLTADDGLTAGTDTVTVSVPDVPAAPTNVDDGGDGDRDGDYYVTWDAVSVTGTTIVYHLEEANSDTSSAPTSSWTEIWSGTSTSHLVSHPGNGHYYYWYRLRAEDQVGSASIGFSPYSARHSIHLVVAPGQPATISPANGSTSTGAYTISWGLYDGSVVSSKVFYELNEANNLSFSGEYLVYTGTARTKNITNSLGDWYYHVRACNQDGSIKACSAWRNKAHEIVTGTGGGGGGGGQQQQQIFAPGSGTTLAPIGGSTSMALPAEMPALDGGAEEVQPPPVEGTNIAAEKLAFVAAPTALRHTRRSGYPVQLAASTDTAVRPLYDQPVYKAYADTKLVQATVTTQTVRFSVKYLYTSNGYMSALVNGIDNARILWQVNKNATNGADAGGNYAEYGMDARGNVTDAIAGTGAHAVNTHYGYAPDSGYLASIGSTSGTTTYQALSYQWFAIGNLKERDSNANGVNLSEAFTYDLHNRLLTSQVGNSGGVQPQVSYQYDSLGDITHKTDGTGTTDYTYGFSGAHPHAVATLAVSGTTTASYNYDANGNMNCRDGAGSSCTGSPTGNVLWNSDNLPTNITQDANNYSNFFYGPDKHRYKQVAATNSTSETTLYLGEMEVVIGATTEYRHTLTAYGRPVYLEKLTTNTGGNPVETRGFALTDHLGSVDVIVDDGGSVQAQESFDVFGKRRNWGSWTGAPSSTEVQQDRTVTHHGFTHHEEEDNLGLVHMNGRVMDPVSGRFMSVDPVFQAPRNSQSVNPYSYVMNNPLSLADPSGYCASTDPSTGGDSTGCDGGGSTDEGNGDRLYKGHNDEVQTGSHTRTADTGASCGSDCHFENTGNGRTAVQETYSRAMSSSSDINSSTQRQDATSAGDRGLGNVVGGGEVSFADNDKSQSSVPIPCDTDDDCQVKDPYINHSIISVIGGRPNERSAVRQDLDKIEDTPRGKELMKMQLRKNQILTIRIDNQQILENSAVGGSPAVVNAEHSYGIHTTAGDREVSLLRSVAHEIGHAISGIRDSGPNNMDNINANENPIVTHLQNPEPARTSYDLVWW